MTPRAWYRFSNQADDPTVAELFVFDDIGKSYWDDNTVTAKQFLADLKALGAGVTKVVVRINSLGGDVFDAVAIANALRGEKAKGRTIDTVNEGIAASAASIVLMAGDTIRMADNALVMVHDPWTIAIGNSREMRKVAESLDVIRDQIVNTYKWHSSLSDEELRNLMAAETWMDADQAIANGFATEKITTQAAAASLNRRAFARVHVPDQYRDRVAALVVPETTAPASAEALEVIAAVEAAGLSTAFARALVADRLPMEQVQARIAAAAADATAARERADSITALCDTAALPQLAAGYIRGGITLDDVRTQLTTVKALIHKDEIDTGLRPDARHQAASAINTTDIYAARNGK